MQIIKSLFAGSMFLSKQKPAEEVTVKPYDVFSNKKSGQRVYVLNVGNGIVKLRNENSLIEHGTTKDTFTSIYRKIS